MEKKKEGGQEKPTEITVDELDDEELEDVTGGGGSGCGCGCPAGVGCGCGCSGDDEIAV